MNIKKDIESLIESISSIEKRHQMVSLLSTFFDT